MTLDDLRRAVLVILPNAQLEEDLSGQIIIYTDLQSGHGEQLSVFDSKDDK